MFAGWPGLSVCSAGTNNDAENPLTADLIEWADRIFAMERVHRTRMQAKFRSLLDGKPIVVLGIPDDYAFMDETLVHLLKARMSRWLPDG